MCTRAVETVAGPLFRTVTVYSADERSGIGPVGASTLVISRSASGAGLIAIGRDTTLFDSSDSRTASWLSTLASRYQSPAPTLFGIPTGQLGPFQKSPGTTGPIVV